MAWIRTIGDAEAEGALRAHYRDAIARAGRVFAIVRVMSLEPRTLHASMELYQATTTAPESPLPRWFRELIAVTVSSVNHCVY